MPTTPTASAPPEPSLTLGLQLREYDAFCQRCGRRAGSRFVLDMDRPADGFFRVLCRDCCAGDDWREVA